MDTYALDEYVHSLMAKSKVPGIAIGILNGDERYCQGFGVTNLRHPLPIDSRTLFQICSISKTYLATLAMMLIEEGQLALDAPARDYLPDFRVIDEAASEQATFRMLLQHRAGWIGDWFTHPSRTGDGADALTRYVETMRELPQQTPVGTAPFSYNNAGFNLAARIIEVITGQSYEEAVQERLFDPLGIRRSHFLPGEFMTRRFVSGHFHSKEGVVVAERWGFGRAFNGAGGITSCVEDVLKYARFHLDGGVTASGERLISEAGIRQLHEVEHYQSADYGIGLAFWGTRIGDLWQYGHSCGGVGQSSVFFFIPERQFAMMIATNSGTGYAVAGKVRAWALAELLGIPAVATSSLSLNETQLAEYEGLYELAGGKARIARSENGADTLTIRSLHEGTYPDKDAFSYLTEGWSDPLPLRFISEDTALIDPAGEEEATPHYGGFDLIFQRDSEGRVYAIQAGARLLMRAEEDESEANSPAE